MNDRFRFRCFDTDIQKFIVGFRLCDHYKWPNGIIEQCTGLKDKNGNLIYEGDIVKATFKYTGSNIENLCFAVAFSDGAFGYFDELGRFGLLANLGTGVMFNVVGNIHENPELLEDK
ncbi:hypothetical protein IJI18_00790 [Candidatus Saccharibacteria bacterium]|nr:hypothetical protein [Candidatus Saccharibacteria bacterium]